jgi:RHS repeat-associated protein
MSGPLAEANTYRFSSKEIHPASGLYYFGRRWYNPNLQRWMARDPSGMVDGPNLYAYVRNRSVNSVDAWGEALFIWGVSDVPEDAPIYRITGSVVEARRYDDLIYVPPSQASQLFAMGAIGLVGAVTLPEEAAGTAAFGLVLFGGYVAVTVAKEFERYSFAALNAAFSANNSKISSISGTIRGNIPTPPTRTQSTIIDIPGSAPPFRGPPNSIVRGGTQTTEYGPDGYPVKQRDIADPHHPEEEVHDWTRPPGGGPPEAPGQPNNPYRGPGRTPRPDDPPPPRGPGVPPPPPTIPPARG